MCKHTMSKKSSIAYILNVDSASSLKSDTHSSPPPVVNYPDTTIKDARGRRVCDAPGCTYLVASRGRCIGHGGGVRCKAPHCTNGAKHNGACWAHGGSRGCTVDGCRNRTKARGVCWSHGGGKRCMVRDCSKTALRYGYCWAHGGGKRCQVDGCNRLGLQRYANCCARHWHRIVL